MQYRIGEERNRLDLFGYNQRFELTKATVGSNIYGYAFDSIGNREWSVENVHTNLYAVNELNQYTATSGSAPFRSEIPVHHAHPDNGSEFINHLFVKSLAELHPEAQLSRSRPYRKNDNCRICGVS